MKTGNWNDAATWKCGTVAGDGPPRAIDSATINGSHVVSLDTSATVTALTVNTTGALQQRGSVTRTLTVTGAFTNSGTVADNGTSGSFDLSVGGDLTDSGAAFTVDKLSVTGSTTSTSTAFTVGGDLTAAAFAVDKLVFKKAGTQAANFNGASTSVGNFTVNSGSTVSSTASAKINLTGNLLVNGTLNLPNAEWLINGTAAQRVGGVNATTLDRLTMNNPGGLTLTGNVIVHSLLTLTRGVIDAGNFALSITAACPNSIIGGSAASHVNGKLRLTYPGSSTTCVYPVGDAKAYAPISLTIPPGSASAAIAGATLTGSTKGGEHPQIATSGIDTYLDVNRYWTLGEDGDILPASLGAKTYSVGLDFVSTDIDAGAIVADFKVGKYGPLASPAWSALAGSVKGMTATLTNQTGFGSYAVGAKLLPVILKKEASSGAAAVNSYLTFNLSVTNENAVDVRNVVVTDVIPPELKYLASSATDGSASDPASGQTLTWIIPLLNPGASAQLDLVVQPTKVGTFTNTATSGLKSASADVLVLPESFVQYQMDEAVGSWTDAKTVFDNGINKLDGHRRTTSTSTTTNAVVPIPTIAESAKSQNLEMIQGDFCNAGNFDGNGVVESASSEFFQFTNVLSASAWIYPTAYPTGGNLYSILSNDTNYEFHLDSGGHLYWWWNAATLTSAASIPLNQWTHVAITLNSSASNNKQRIYINGVVDKNTNNWKGELEKNGCPFYIGGDIHTYQKCALIPERNFHGKIDEVKIYNYELNAAEVKADMTLGRLCGGVYDHIRIVHDGSASTCAPKPVMVKACMNASCSALYPAPVQVKLSPGGKTPSDWNAVDDIVTIKGGSIWATLSNGSISVPKLTLGATGYGTALPVNPAVRCFNGLKESTCDLVVATNSCQFNAAEVTKDPQTTYPKTNIFTKLSDEGFSLDVLAADLKTVGPGKQTAVDTANASEVEVDLVDASSQTCSSASTALNTAQKVPLVRGRATVPFKIPAAAKAAQVRIRIGSTTACSTDNFTIRPKQLTVTAPAMTNVKLTGKPTATAGSAFTLTAESEVPFGYTGTPTVDTTKVNDHKATAIATGTLSGSFDAATGKSASGKAFKYLDVGTITFTENAVVDSEFVVDPPGVDCLKDSTSNQLSGGLYGCVIGSVAPAEAFGRWVPSHYSFRGKLTPAYETPSPGFTYMGQDKLTVSLSVTAHAINLSGSAAADTDPILNRYTAGYPNLAEVTFKGWDDGVVTNGSHEVPASRLVSPSFPAMPNKALWNSGVFRINDTYAFSKPDPLKPLDGPGPYDLFKLKMSLGNDPDNATPSIVFDSSLIPAPVSAETNTTRIRLGRLRVDNAYGSEFLDLTLSLQAQYWDGKSWVLNVADTTGTNGILTAAGAASAGVALSDYKGPPLPAIALSATNFGVDHLADFTSDGVAKWKLKLKKPSPTATGSVDLCIDLGPDPVAPRIDCSAAASLDIPWLQSLWSPGTTYDNDPRAKVTFGTYKSLRKLIHRREVF